VYWTELPVALYPPYPNNPLDTSGRFTGIAVQDDSELRLIFTDFTDVTFHLNALLEVVLMANSTHGVTFHLYAGNPVVSAPPVGSPSGFRDPKVSRDPIDNG
jgi:beta-fructofuranosidase